MTNDFPGPFARRYETHLKHLKLGDGSGPLPQQPATQGRSPGSGGAANRSRRLDLHPHVHLAMPAATLDPRQRRWRTRTGYLFNHQALAKVLRGKRVSGGRTSVLVQAPMHCVSRFLRSN